MVLPFVHRWMPATVPLDLPRLVMRRAALAALAVLLVALLLGLRRMGDDIDDEVDAAMTLATLVARLGSLPSSDDAQALAALDALQRDRPLRHLVLQVQDEAGRSLLAPAAAAPPPRGLQWLLDVHSALLPSSDSRRVAWAVERPAGHRWTVSLAASHESERREAMTDLLGTLALLLGSVAGLLLVMRWNMRRAFAPLGRLLAAIQGIERSDARAVQALPAMPIRELEAVAAALRHLAGALDEAEARRRRLGQQVLTLQEDERARLARELHDEFGQRLTALRVDAAWLSRRCSAQPALQAVADGMGGHCQQIQQDIRALLARLQPFGPASSAAQADGSASEPLQRLVGLLQALVAGWQAQQAVTGTACALQLRWQDADGTERPWPPADAGQGLALPQALALTLYRISQECLTNVARHAAARQATVRLCVQGPAQAGAALQLQWSVADDGIGLADAEAAAARGNGLAGIRERIWAQGGDLGLQPAAPGSARPGLLLRADFATRWAPQPADGATGP